MQSIQNIPRGTVLFISGVAALAIAYVAFKQTRPTAVTVNSSDQNLHRRNAVRRRTRRRWREGVQRVGLDYDPTQRALESLQRREESGSPYAIYANGDWTDYLHDEPVQENDRSFFGLLPSRLDAIHTEIVRAQDLADVQAKALRMNLQAQFMKCFLETEYPEGYLVLPDHQQIEMAMSPHIPRYIVYGLLKLWDSGNGHLMCGNNFELPAVRINADQTTRPAEGSETQTIATVTEVIVPQSHSPGSHGPATGDNRTAADLATALAVASGRGAAADEEEEHTILDVLYRIAEEQAKRRGYQHRGVECNSCGMQPILGIRYHCANCYDYDLCEACESQQFHAETHVFYKIRIPAPTRGQIKMVQPKWYPGQPSGTAALSVPEPVKSRLLQATTFDRQDIDALYDQFKCVASVKMVDDEDKIGVAIGRRDFDRYFTTTTADLPPKPNALYDRIFKFYSGGNETISFDHFVTSMHQLVHETTRESRVERLFHCFDRNDSGYVCRRDFLVIFKAHYELNKEIAREIVFAGDDGILSDGEMIAAIHANHPISAAFAGVSFRSVAGNDSLGKHLDQNGDLILDSSTAGVLHDDSDMNGNRTNAIEREAAAKIRFDAQPDGFSNVIADANDRTILQSITQAETDLDTTISMNPEDEESLQADQWYNDGIRDTDVLRALGTTVSLDKITDVSQRQKVLDAQRERVLNAYEQSIRESSQSALFERWQKRQFYLDVEEGLTKPVGYHESDESESEEVNDFQHVSLKETKNELRRTSLRSRSSSKVRFDINDEEVDRRSDVSSRNTPLNERWGGVEFPLTREDTGVEIVYEAVQESFNAMLDHFFKDVEDQAIVAQSTRPQRRKHIALLEKYQRKLEEQNSILEQKPHTNINGTTKPSTSYMNGSASKTKSAPLITDLAPPDPTLPQNRPDEVDDHTLATWLKHQQLEEEADLRNGWGKLSKQEFKRKLRDDKGHELDIGGEGDDDHSYWTEKADLGRFSHLSTWIEMASF